MLWSCNTDWLHYLNKWPSYCNSAVPKVQSFHLSATTRYYCHDIPINHISWTSNPCTVILLSLWYNFSTSRQLWDVMITQYRLISLFEQVAHLLQLCHAYDIVFSVFCKLGTLWQSSITLGTPGNGKQGFLCHYQPLATSQPIINSDWLYQLRPVFLMSFSAFGTMRFQLIEHPHTGRTFACTKNTTIDKV